MARTFSAFVVDKEEWNLTHALSSQLIKKLRERGFYANFKNLRELELHCIRFAKDPHAESAASRRAGEDGGDKQTQTDSLSSKAETSSGATYICQVEHVVQSPSTENINDDTKFNGDLAENPDSISPVNGPFPCKELSDDQILDEWCLVGKDGKIVPIMELSYDVSDPNEIILSGYITAKHQRISTRVLKWKFVSTAEKGLVIYVKTTLKSMWSQLGKPQTDYEQTIKSVLVYMHLFSMPKEATGRLKTILLHLQNKFHYWPVKPSVSDLQDCLLLAKKLDLSSTFPKIMEEIEESNDGNDSMPLPLKHLERQKVEIDSHELGSPMDKSSMSAPGNNSNNIVRRSTKEEKTLHEQSEHVLVDHADIAHAPLSSIDQNLKESKESCHSTEDRALVATRNAGLRKRTASQAPVDAFEFHHTSSEEFNKSCQIDEKQNVSEPDKIKERIRGIMKECDSGQLGKRCNYSTGPFVAISKLWAITSAAQQALDYLDEGGSVEEAMRMCPKESLNDFFENEVILQKYGISKFLPTTSKQKEVAEKINYYANDGDTVLEICSQTADYFSLLKERLASLGKHCDYKRFILDQLQNKDIKELLSIEELPTGSKLLVCLSFCFSVPGELSNTILDYALELKPKLIVIIAPLFSRRLEEYTSYNLVWVDSEILQNEILWPWGLMDVPSIDLEKKKGISPIVYVWSRADWIWKHHHIASRFGHLQLACGS